MIVSSWTTPCRGKRTRAYLSSCFQQGLYHNLSRNTKRGFLFVPIAEWHKHEAHHLTIAPQVNVRTNGANDKE
ncbi:MAG: hypothetical protein IKS01_02030 [Paludibacteraceae bacterium]|nr:hypothetical protein [Paludibacteraceae bacterium]